MTNTEYLRAHLLAWADVDKAPVLWPDLDTLRQSEWSTAFEQLMRNRLIFGGGRYGWIRDPSKPDYCRMKSIVERAQKYIETGNDELLPDIANLALIEYVDGRHPTKHFKAIDAEQDRHVKVADKESR